MARVILEVCRWWSVQELGFYLISSSWVFCCSCFASVGLAGFNPVVVDARYLLRECEIEA